MNFEKYLENQECIVYSAKRSGKLIYLGIFLIIFVGILFPYFSGLTGALFGGNCAFSTKDCLSMFAFFFFWMDISNRVFFDLCFQHANYN